ncbi:MAG: phosphatase PAP2 family protein [Muribaculaceae bacterium]|nr:phosphatase PAP2 family protein [Muribaculaceae bacterium]
MKLDTSSYYPKSPLDDEEAAGENQTGGNSLFPDSKAPDSDKEAIAPGPAEKVEERREEPQPSAPIYDPGEGERFIDNLSTLLSWILVPLLMPVYGVILAFNLSILDYMPFANKLTFTLITASINVALPALLVVLLKRMGLVEDLGLNGRKERFIPYLITIIAMAGTGWFMWTKHAPLWFVMFFAGGAAAGVINMIINFKWKISAHSAAIAGIVALLIRIMHEGSAQPSVMVWIIVWVALSGLLGSARIWLGRHTVAQVFTGYAVGFLSVFLLTMIR